MHLLMSKRKEKKKEEKRERDRKEERERDREKSPGEYSDCVKKKRKILGN